MDPYVSKKLSVLRFLGVAAVVVYHAYQFEPGVFFLAPARPSSVTDFLEGYISLALMRWALPFLGLVSGYLFFRNLVPTPRGGSPASCGHACGRSSSRS
jgi:peptidoglycan/LPS O-acetylase OafA/YrhL